MYSLSLATQFANTAVAVDHPASRHFQQIAILDDHFRRLTPCCVSISSSTRAEIKPRLLLTDISLT